MNHIDDGDWELIYDGASQPSVVVFTKNGLIAGGHYRFKVASLNVRGESTTSSPEAIYLCAALPFAPTQPQHVSST